MEDGKSFVPTSQGLHCMNNNLAQSSLDFDQFKEYPRGYGSSREGTSGLSRESSRDDLNSLGDQHFEYEERFRVDRRKLELMMLGSEGVGKIYFYSCFNTMYLSSQV